MPNPALFQIAIAVAGLGFLLFFLDSMDTENPGSLESKITGALLLYTVSLFSLLIPATTRESYQLLGIYIPPLQVWLEAFTMGFLVSAAWEIFYRS